MSNYTNFLFYGSWRETLEGYREDFGEEYAREALWNLMLMATAGDIETDKKSIIGFVQGACMPNIEAAQDRYERAQKGGQNGGRPKLLSSLDEQVIATMRQEGRTAIQIGEMLGVSEKTVRRTEGWKQYKTYCATDKTDKTDPKTQNPEKDIDIDIDNQKEKENSCFDYLYNRITSDGFVEDKNEFLDFLCPEFYSSSRADKILILRELQFSEAEAAYIIDSILE